ncbi:phage tail tube protein [Desulfosporosinus sp. SB140]|uniref:phage tail tube protein n=1 Tax=Desulfosporosinus paludis TaxID=3115649 RepID=UPI00388FCA02
MPIISYNSRAGLAKETTWGTAITAPTTWIPFKTLKSEDDIKRVIDDGIRGNLSKDFASYAGVASAKYDLDGMVYPDVFGNLLLAILGQDSVSGTSPYTHAFTLAATQPPSYTLTDYDGVNERQFAGSILQQLDLKFTTEGELSKSTKWVSKLSTLAGSIHTPTYGTVQPIVGYQAALTIAGAGNTRLIGGDLSLKRDVKFTFGANNSQSPTKVNVGKLEVTGKLDFEIDDYTELQYYLNATQPIVVLTFTSGANILTIQMSKCDFEKIAGIDRSQEMARVSASIRGIYNTTDAGPIKISLVNSVASY